MKAENDLMPYQCTPLPKGPWLVFAPHPDDESFGMGGSLLLAAEQGIEINLVFITDGALGSKDQKKELVPIRQKEAEAVAKALHAKNVIFLNEPDRHLSLTAKLVAQIAGLIEKTSPQSIFFPSPMELHPDHRTTALLVWEALSKSTPHQGKAYSYDISIQGQVNTLIDISAVVTKKRQLMSLYQSQLGENDYIGVIESLDRARTYTLGASVKAAEGFYQFPSVQGELTEHTMSSLRPYWEETSKLPAKQRLVSIIVRTKNRPDMLKQALRSLAEQSHPNIELIIVNDGGVDITDVYSPFSSLFSSIQSHQYEHTTGRSNAANKGLSMASGDYIGFLDDDDWLAPDHISTLAKTLECHAEDNIVAAYTSTECVDTSSNTIVRTYAQPFDSTLLKLENYIPLHSLLLKRKAISSNKKCAFDPSLDLFEDWDFWLQLSSIGSFVHVDKVTAFYRIAAGSGEGVYADEKRSIGALEKIAKKWVTHLSAEEYMQLIGRVRFLKRQTIELESLRCQAELDHEKRVSQEKSTILEIYENEIKRIGEANQSEIQRICKVYENEIKRLADEGQHTLQHLSQNHKEELQQLIKSHQTENLSLTTKYEEEIQTISSGYELEIQKQVQQQVKISTNYEKEISRLSAENRAILNSTSWKITKPIRFLKRMFTSHHPINHAIKNTLYTLAIFIYRMPLFRKLIQRIPFVHKQRIRNYLVNNRPAPEQSHAESSTQSASALVSIVIPVYNHAEYLRQCIDSAINQSWPNTEVLICDDASPDPKVKEILQEYVAHPRCTVIFSEKNSGICNTQNKLLAIAEGKIIAFLDCDDYLTPNAVERSMQHWKEDTVYLHTGRINVDEKGDEINRISFELLPRKDYFEENLERMFATHFKLIHRDAIAKVGAFDTRFDSAQDYDMLMRIAFHFPTEAFVHLPEFLYSHRLHKKQTTETMNKKQLDNTATIQSEARLRKSIQQGKFKHFISIIMLSYGKKKQTLTAIQSLEKTVKIPHEIILFDNGSQNETVDFIRANIDGHFENVKVYYNDSNLGPAAGRREALKQASGAWVIIFDNDEIAEPGWLEELLVRACSDENIGAVCCKVIFPDKNLQFSGGYIRHTDDQLVELDLYDRGKSTYDLSSAVFRDCDWCPIGATLFTLNPARYLHEGYPNVFEDAGVSMALKKQGKRLVNSPGSWVWHEHIVYQKKAEVDMHDKYLSDRYNPKRMLTSIKSFYNENNLIIHDEYIWRENGLYNLSRSELIEQIQKCK